MHISPIAYARTPFKQKFGIPRQPSLIKSVDGTIELEKPYASPDSVKGLSEFSHIWLQFGFHQHEDAEFKPLVRPPRLGGNEKIGVFATRSSFRPNALGLSLVELKEVIAVDHKVRLIISCPDLLDCTPIYDIKPFIKYSDNAEHARCGYASNTPQSHLRVTIRDGVKSKMVFHYGSPHHLRMIDLITEVLSQDPRPAYRASKPDEKTYSMKLYDFDLHWKVTAEAVEVFDITFE